MWGEEFEGGRRLGEGGFGDCHGDFNCSRTETGFLLEDAK